MFLGRWSVPPVLDFVFCLSIIPFYSETVRPNLALNSLNSIIFSVDLGLREKDGSVSNLLKWPRPILRGEHVTQQHYIHLLNNLFFNTAKTNQETELDSILQIRELLISPQLNPSAAASPLVECSRPIILGTEQEVITSHAALCQNRC